MEWQEQVDLGASNTLALPCIADFFLSISDEQLLVEAISQAKKKYSNEAPLILGGGSNIVLPPRLKRPVIKLEFHQLAWQEFEDTAHVTAGAAVVWDEFVKSTIDRGWSGLENLSLIPGTVGASPIQNIGAYGVELCDVFVNLRAYDLKEHEIVTLNKSDCDFAYRDSIFKHEAGRYIIINVTLELHKRNEFALAYGELKALEDISSDQVNAQMIRDKVIEVRQAKLPDPVSLPNAGSFFKNPVVSSELFQSVLQKWPGIIAYEQQSGVYKLAAGWMIDQLGWKGKRSGPVGMHDKQALVMVNYGGAQQNDVLGLAKKIQKSVKEGFNVELEIEPVVVTEEVSNGG